MKSEAEVIVYKTSWCAFCHTETQWLDSLGVKYIAKDIEADQSAYEELTKKNRWPVKRRTGYRYFWRDNFWL